MNTMDLVSAAAGSFGVGFGLIWLACRSVKKEEPSFNECKSWWNDNGGRVGIVMWRDRGIRIETHKPNTCQPDTPEKPKMYRLVSGGDDQSGKARMVTEFMPITKFVPLIQRFQNEEFDTVFNSEFFKRKNRVNKNPTFTLYGE